MKYTRKLGMLLFAMALAFGAMAVSASAQHRGFHRRPVIVRHFGLWGDPFYRGFGYWGDPFWNDPYYWEMRDRYYDQKAVNDASKKLNKDRIKYAEDGVITAKEAEKLAKDRTKLEKEQEELRKDND